MGAPINNQNARGNRGGGRKSAYQEYKDARFLASAFFDKHSKDEILDEINSGKYSLSQLVILKAMEGSERLLVSIMNKLFSDAQPFEETRNEDVERALNLLEEQIDKERKDVKSGESQTDNG